jgi:hypothetical protein
MNDQVSNVRCVSAVARSTIPAVCMYMSGWCLWSERAGGCVVIRLRARTFKVEIWGESGGQRERQAVLETRFDDRSPP